MWHTVVVSSTEWLNFFSQRCSPLAQPEIRFVAESMRAALLDSSPTLLYPGQWHMPYISDEEMAELTRFYLRDVAHTIAAARCARVSYLTHDGLRDWSKDRDLFKKLVSAEPPHASPLEHVARPCNGAHRHLGNFTGWDQLRHLEL
jgi:thymidylate synthase ThyX